MHESQNVLNTVGVASKASISLKRQLTAGEAIQLQSAISNDILGYVRHAAVALAEGIAGIELALSTWATVQLYYCVFYSARAWIGTQGVCIFYSGTSPHVIEAKPGAVALKLKGSTHQVALQEFAKRNKNSFFLSQQIEQLSPLEWLCRLRDIANYKNANPFEPGLCENFLMVRKIGVRKAISSYLTGSNRDLYTFDKDHALLALPLCFFDETRKVVCQHGARVFGEDFQKIVCRLLKDKAGYLTSVTRLIS